MIRCTWSLASLAGCRVDNVPEKKQKTWRTFAPSFVTFMSLSNQGERPASGEAGAIRIHRATPASLPSAGDWLSDGISLMGSEGHTVQGIQE